MDTSLVMTDGKESFGILFTFGNGKVIDEKPLTLKQLNDIQMNRAPLGEDQGAIGFVLRLGDASTMPNGELQICIEQFINSLGGTDFKLIKLYPEEWSYANGVISIMDTSFNAIPALAQFKA